MTTPERPLPDPGSLRRPWSDGGRSGRSRSGSARSRRRRRRRLVVQLLLFVGLPLLILTALVAWRLYRIADRLESARTIVDGVQVLVQQGDLAGADSALSLAERQVLAANSEIHGSPELGLVGWIPGMRQNLRAVKNTVGVGVAMVGGGRDVLEAARPLADAAGQVQVPLRNGAVPVDVVLKTQLEADQLASALPGPGEKGRSWVLLPPVKHLQSRIYDEAARRKAQFQNVAAGLQLLAEMSGGRGDRRYLIAVSNAAEMRGTGGMYLSYAVLTSKAGKFSLERVGNIDELRLEDPPTLTRPPEYVTRLRNLQPSLLWRNANLSPDFTAVAPVLEAMFEKATGQRADGVIQIDSHGLAAILSGIGPVLVPSLGVVSADNAVALTLNEAYVLYPDRTARQDLLGDVAEATFQRLVSGDYPTLRPLAAALVDTAAARHIIVHSRQQRAQRAVVRLGADGSLPVPDVDFIDLNVQNFAGNKLDYYLDTKLSVTGPRPAGRPARVKVAVDLANTAPVNGSPPYIFGPVDPSLRAGEYRGVVSVYLPRGTRLVSHEGGPVVGAPATGSDSGRTVVTFGVSIPAGASRSVTLVIDLPSRSRAGYTWEFVPVPRVRPTVASLDLDTGRERLRVEQQLVRTVTVPGKS